MHLQCFFKIKMRNLQCFPPTEENTKNFLTSATPNLTKNLLHYAKIFIDDAYL
jgi:hypothetical protein